MVSLGFTSGSRRRPGRRRASRIASPRAAGPGSISAPGTRTAAPSALNAADVAYLKDRALRFQQVISQIAEVPFEPPRGEDGRLAVAALAAIARFGDDVDYATGRPSVEFNAIKWEAAHALVRDNIMRWFDDAFGTPTAPSPP